MSFLQVQNLQPSHARRYTPSLDYCTAYSAPLPIVDCVGLDFVDLVGMTDKIKKKKKFLKKTTELLDALAFH